MTTKTQQPDPERREVGGDDPGATYETPLTLGPDADHTDDPIRHYIKDPQATDHPVGDSQAQENAENEPPG